MQDSSNITFKDVKPYLGYLDFTSSNICTDLMLELTNYCSDCPFRALTLNGAIIDCKFNIVNLTSLRFHIAHVYPELLI